MKLVVDYTLASFSGFGTIGSMNLGFFASLDLFWWPRVLIRLCLRLAMVPDALHC